MASFSWLANLWSPRRARRRGITQFPFPSRSRKLLSERSSHYRRLPPELRREFDGQMQVFLAQTRMTGVEMKVTDELRILVGASAVALSAGWTDYKWDRVSEVLLYPDSFDRDYKFGVPEYAGQAHPWGIVILSAPALRRSFKVADEPYHVGYHEFAHLLDLTSGRFDGVPPYLSDDSIRQWENLARVEDERLRRGDSVLDPYALTAPEEFFAVAVEAFFQIPGDLEERHAELYGFLRSYFRQDQAAWRKPSSEQ